MFLLFSEFFPFQFFLAVIHYSSYLFYEKMVERVLLISIVNEAQPDSAGTVSGIPDEKAVRRVPGTDDLQKGK